MVRFRFFCLFAASALFGAAADIVVPPPEWSSAAKKDVAVKPAAEPKQEKSASLNQVGVGRARYTLLALHSAHVNAAYRALCSFLGEKTVAAQGIDKVYEVLDAAINRDDYGDYRIDEQKKQGRFYVTTITRPVTREWLVSKLEGLPELRRKLQEDAKCTR